MTTRTLWAATIAVSVSTLGFAQSTVRDLPQEFVDAANRLFERGAPDPRGKEYRTAIAMVRKMRTSVAGWVSPAHEGGPRTVVCWDGLSYGVEEAGEARDLAVDVRAGVAAIRSPTPSLDLARPQGAIAVALLVRAGRSDLARELFEEFHLDRGLDAAKRSVRKLNAEVATKRYARAVDSFRNGDYGATATDAGWIVERSDLLGPDALRRAASQGPSAEDMHDDAVRRLGKPARPDAKAEKVPDLPPEARAEALIEKLDDVRLTHGLTPFVAEIDPVLAALIRLGDAAVDPLIDCLENDRRLSRSFHYNPSGNANWIVSVRHLAATIIERITQVHELPRNDDGLPKVAELRAYWSRMRRLPFMERQYRMLAEDAAAPRQWLEAASLVFIGRGWVLTDASGKSYRQYPEEPSGEVLRSKTSPSVTELLAKRATSLLPPRGEVGMSTLPLEMALYLAKWDASGGAKALNAVIESAEYSILKLQRQSIKKEMETALRNLKAAMEKDNRPGTR